MSSPRSSLAQVTERYAQRQRGIRRLLMVLVFCGLLPASVAAWVDGRVPAPIPPPKDKFTPVNLFDALQAVDSRTGTVDLSHLANRRGPLDTFVESLASTSPLNLPDEFPRPEDKLAYWLNAYNALVLQQLADGWPTVTTTKDLSYYRRTWPVGGQRLTLFAIRRRFLAPAEDARIYFGLFSGARGGGILDGAPFDGASLNPQLDDAARRFLRRKENLSIIGSTVRLSGLLKSHEQEFLAALPDERRNLLQIVWAFLPENCEGQRPGCDTRNDLDKACGPHLDKCTVVFSPVDEHVPLRQAEGT